MSLLPNMLFLNDILYNWNNVIIQKKGRPGVRITSYCMLFMTFVNYSEKKMWLPGQFKGQHSRAKKKKKGITCENTEFWPWHYYSKKQQDQNIKFQK